MNESPFSALLFPLHSTLLHSIPLRSILPHSTPLHSIQCFIPFHSTTPHHTTPHHSIPFQSTPLHSTSTQLSSSLASFSFGCNHRVQATTRYLDFSCSALPSLSLSQFYFSPFFVLLYPIRLSSSPLLPCSYFLLYLLFSSTFISSPSRFFYPFVPSLPPLF